MRRFLTALAVGPAFVLVASAAMADDSAQPSEASTSATIEVSKSEQAKVEVAKIVNLEEMTRDFAPAFATQRIGAFVDLWPARHHLVTTFGAEMQIRIAPRLFLDMSYAGAFASMRGVFGSDSDNIGFGNPTVGLHFAGSAAQNFHFYMGGSVTAPVLHDPSESVSNAAAMAQRIRGYADADRFAKGHMAVRAAYGLEWNAIGPLHLRAEVKPVLFIPTSNKYRTFADARGPVPSKGEVDFAVEEAVEVEARSSMGLGAGVRLQGVMMPTEDDTMQTVVEPMVQLTPKRDGVYMRLGFPVALDEGLGFGFDEDKLAGVRLNIGGQW